MKVYDISQYQSTFIICIRIEIYSQISPHTMRNRMYNQDAFLRGHDKPVIPKTKSTGIRKSLFVRFLFLVGGRREVL